MTNDRSRQISGLKSFGISPRTPGGGVDMSKVVSATFRSLLAESLEQSERTERARQAVRCQQVKTDGVRCGSPAMRGGPFCYFHERMVNRMPPSQFPPLEDGNAIQCAIMQVLDGVAAGRMDRQTANTLLYGLQTASANLRKVRFEPPSYLEGPVTRMPHDERRPVCEEAAAENVSEAG